MFFLTKEVMVDNEQVLYLEKKIQQGHIAAAIVGLNNIVEIS